jgi:transcriptional regulator with PAS, ATPase and Fis domain
MIKQGTFREDLFYRLNVIHIVVPPLRDRREDIPVLAHQFLTPVLGGRAARVSPASRPRR